MLREPARNIRPKRVEFYGEGLPGYTKRESKGRLIVVEGPDAAGRTVQVNLIQAHLETAGHAVASTGLRRSELISPGILSAKQKLPMGKKTLALFYAADFADQLEHKILPSLHAGFVVLADRYIYTLLARSAVRGISRRWSRDLFGFALKPDLAFCLDVEPLELFHRAFQKGAALDYYESGGTWGFRTICTNPSSGTRGSWLSSSHRWRRGTTSSRSTETGRSAM